MSSRASCSQKRLCNTPEPHEFQQAEKRSKKARRHSTGEARNLWREPLPPQPLAPGGSKDRETCRNGSVHSARQYFSQNTEPELRSVLTVLDECKHKMRNMRCPFTADSDPQILNAVLESISELQSRASELLRTHPSGLNLDSGRASGCEELGSRHHACNHYAGLLSGTWFRDISSSIDMTNNFVSHFKSVITGTWQAVGASENTAGAARNELLSRLQPLNTMFSAAVWAGDAEKLLCCCANEAADWAAEGSRQLKHVLCAQDDALANVTENTAKQLESQGDSYLSQGDKLLCQGSEGRIMDVLTNFVHAKAAYDEANSIKSFDVNRPSKVFCQVTPNVSCLYCLSFFYIKFWLLQLTSF